jgi:uncharacterized protein (DUF302 family)
MLHVTTTRRLDELEPALCRAAQHRDMRVLAVTHLGRLLAPETRSARDMFVFTVCHTGMYAALLAAEQRLATILPCRIAARMEGESVIMETLSPREFCRFLGRDDLDALAAPLENLLKEVMEEVAQPVPAGAAAAKGDYTLGATEGQMNVRGTLPTRMDCHGTHVEDLAGTGKMDSPGG